MKILFIEDNDDDIASFDNAVDIYNQKNADTYIEVEKIKSIAEFEDKANELENIDAVIVDIKLQNKNGTTDADAGNKIIKMIENSLHCVPLYIYTGTPGNINYQGDFVIRRYTKGEETTYKQVIDDVYKLHKTKLMQIIGGKGKIKELIQRIYKENIIKNVDKWIEHKNCGKNTEEILSRYIAACIMGHLENSSEAVKEEMFMIPPAGTDLKTGSIVKKKGNDEHFVVLTPECDLIPRGEGDKRKPKTDFILLCKLQNDTIGINKKHLQDMLDYKLPYAYCLPKNLLIQNITFLNFRNVISIPYSDIENKNYERVAQILPEFIKEIIQKFSTYYSRQGQPDFSDGELCLCHCQSPP